MEGCLFLAPGCLGTRSVDGGFWTCWWVLLMKTGSKTLQNCNLRKVAREPVVGLCFSPDPRESWHGSQFPEQTVPIASEEWRPQDQAKMSFRAYALGSPTHREQLLAWLPGQTLGCGRHPQIFLDYFLL